MQVENLTEDQVKKAQELFDSFGDPVKHKTYNMEDMDFAKRLTAIEEDIVNIKNRLNMKRGFKKSGYNHNK